MPYSEEHKMKMGLRVTGIFVLQILSLFIAGRIIGNQFGQAEIFLTSPSACIGYVVVFGPLIGISIAGVVLAMYLVFKPATTSTIWTFGAAVALLDILAAIHMKLAFCS